MTEMKDGQQLVLGIEGGATKTEWIYLRCGGGGSEVLQQGRLPAANFKLISRHDLLHLFSLLPKNADRVGVYLPGVLDDEHCRFLNDLASGVWPSASIATGSDRESGLAAAFGNGAGILVISGTGSSITGRQSGQIVKAGGKGHLVGDKGSAYHVAMEALRLVMDRYDETEKPCRLARAILRELALNQVDDIIDWVQRADKPTIASLATIVFQVYREGDPKLLDILRSGTEALAHATVIVARRLATSRPRVALQGSMFTKQEIYVELYKEALNRKLPQARVSICQDAGSVGAARLSTGQAVKVDSSAHDVLKKTEPGHEHKFNRTSAVDAMTAEELVNHFIEEERNVHEVLLECRTSLSRAMEIVAQALTNGGRLIYVGSAHFGMVDVAKVAQAFGEPPVTVQAITTGCASDLEHGVESSRADDPVMGAMAISQKGVTNEDIVCGITVSTGSTSFVLGALDEAKRIGATTLLLTDNPNRPTKSSYGLEVEVITSGQQPLVTGLTATKVALNIITTGAMVLLGKVKSNQMVALRYSNANLKGRVTRLVDQLTGHSNEEIYNQL